VDYAANNQKLLRALLNAPSRRARFRCVIALSSPQGETRCVEGSCCGTIREALAGHHGFGYDPVFQPDGFEKTFGQMDASQKHGWEAGRGDLGLSHRARAFARFATLCLGARS
jgi:XTP/dITP diphosphohydrolase